MEASQKPQLANQTRWRIRQGMSGMLLSYNLALVQRSHGRIMDKEGIRFQMYTYNSSI